MLSYTGALSLVLNGQPNFPIPNLDLESFFTGSGRAIDSISKHIGSRNISHLGSLVSQDCLHGLRENVFERVSPTELSQIRINSDDIFFQYIESVDPDFEEGLKVRLVALSLPRLAECIAVQRKMKNFTDNLYDQASRTDGILRRESMNAAKFRQLQDEVAALNIDKLAKDGSILVSVYTFVRSSQTDWTVTAISHSDTRKIWSLPRQFIWKGRVHIFARFAMDFRTVLRYDYILDTIALAMLMYLQFLAMLLGYRIEKEAERRRSLGLID